MIFVLFISTRLLEYNAVCDRFCRGKAVVDLYHEICMEAIIPFFRATCCQTQITLDASDVAGNERRCTFFQSEIQRSPVFSTRLLQRTSAVPRVSTPPATPPARPPAQTLVTVNKGIVSSSSRSKTTTVSRRRPVPKTTPVADGGVTGLSALLNESIAAFETVTLHRVCSLHSTCVCVCV